MRSILAAGAGTPQPTPAGDALVLELPTVATRPPTGYAIGATTPTSSPTSNGTAAGGTTAGGTAVGNSS